MHHKMQHDFSPPHSYLTPFSIRQPSALSDSPQSHTHPHPYDDDFPAAGLPGVAPFIPYDQPRPAKSRPFSKPAQNTKSSRFSTRSLSSNAPHDAYPATQPHELNPYDSISSSHPVLSMHTQQLPPPPPPRVSRTLMQPAVGSFKDFSKQLPGLPAETVVSGDSAIARLFALKNKLNELQRRRESYWARQGGVASAAVASAALTLGGAFIVSGAAVIHQRNRIAQIKKVMLEVIGQINQIRATFGDEPGWVAAEAEVQIKESIFKTGIERSSLHGDL